VSWYHRTVGEEVVRSCLGVGWSDIVDGSLVKARVEGEEVLGEGNVVTVGGGHLKK
jgi:hypothetical protein